MRCTMQMGTGPVVPEGERRWVRHVFETSSARYEERQPQDELARDVVCFWTLHIDSRERSHVQHILPDLAADVISVDDGPPFVAGPPTAAMRIPISGGTAIKGVRLRAGAARRLFDASPVELLDRHVPLRDLLRAPSARAAAAHDVHGYVAGLLRQTSAEKDPTVRSAISWLAANWRSSVDDLSKHANWSSRELRRRFVAALGMGPKLVQRMVRVQAALHLMRARKGRVALSELAFECGFADQAHMTREIGRFTDHTPTHLRRLAHLAPRGFADRR